MSEEIKNEDVVVESPAAPEVVEEVELAAPVEETVELVEEPVLPSEPVEELKPVEAEEPKNVISSGSQRSSQPAEVAGITSVENGVIGTGKVKTKPKAEKVASKKTDDRVAIYSTKNVAWNGVGKVNKGYNVVSKDVAAKWLEKSYIRVASPEELAKEFGK